MGKPAPYVRAAGEPDHIVLLDIRQDRFISLNRTGSFIWTKLTEGCTEGEIATALAHEAAIEAQDATSSVERYIKKLTAHQLLMS